MPQVHATASLVRDERVDAAGRRACPPDSGQKQERERGVFLHLHYKIPGMRIGMEKDLNRRSDSQIAENAKQLGAH